MTDPCKMTQAEIDQWIADINENANDGLITPEEARAKVAAIEASWLSLQKTEMLSTLKA